MIAAPSIAIQLPQKILIFEGADAKMWLGYNSLRIVGGRISLGSADVTRQFERVKLSVILVAVKATELIQHISAVSFAVRDMARSIKFYEKLLGDHLKTGHSVNTSKPANEGARFRTRVVIAPAWARCKFCLRNVEKAVE